MALTPGMRLGPYEIVGPLGAGGMGEVYRARDSRLNRDVAIKTLPTAFFDDANRLARLEREAQVLAALSHPNIGAIYGLEDDRGVRALVMELVEGPTLAERIGPASGRPAGAHPRPIPLDEALDIARQIADALEAAHEKGIIHRDLKPANIKLTGAASGYPGKVKVLDFGLAKFFETDAASAGSGDSPTLTLESARAGIILGTPAYMSPEQARGKPVDKRTDIWSFGVVLYEMLTGRMTFEGETISDTLAAVLRSEIDWKRLPSEVPPRVRRLLQRCLERDPRKRLRDIGDARLELDATEETPLAPPAAALPPAPPATPAPPAPKEPAAPVLPPAFYLPPASVLRARPVRPRRRWLPWAAAVFMGGAGMGAGWFLWHTPPAPPRPVVRWSYTQKDRFGLPALSRDGTRLAFAEIPANAFRLMLRTMDQAESSPLPGGEGGVYPVFSPDGQWIAFLSSGKLKKIPVTGGTPITLAEKSGPPSDWGENGEILFSAASGFGLMKVAAAGGQPQALTNLDSKKGETRHRDPHFLPGGRAIVFTAETGGSQQVAVLDVREGTHRTLVNDASGARYVRTGHLIYLRGTTLFAAPFDPRRLELTGPAIPVVEGVSDSASAVGEYSFSDSGLLVYMKGAGVNEKTILAWADRKGAMEPFTAAEYWGTGRLSPDGRLVANQIYTSKAPEGDIWIYDVARRSKTRLTFGGTNQYPIWTPDGGRVTFSATAAGKHGIYSAPADGSEKPLLLLETEDRARPTSWSPDGKALVYSMPGKDPPVPRLWVLPVTLPARPEGAPALSPANRYKFQRPGQPYRLHDTPFSEDEGEVSPDGHWLAYTSVESGSPEVYVQPFPGPGGKERISTEGGQAPRWSRNGRELFYLDSTSSRVMSVDIRTTPQFHAGIPTRLFAQRGSSTWDVAPDGNRFLFEQFPAGETGSREMQVVVDWFEELRRRVPAGK